MVKERAEGSFVVIKWILSLIYLVNLQSFLVIYERVES